jgi:restriction system protein
VTDVADRSRAQGGSVARTLLAPVLLIGRVLVLAGIAGLALLVHRHALWGPVAVASLGAGALLAAVALLRRALSVALLRARLHGSSLAELDRMSGAAFEDWVVRCLTKGGFRCHNLPRTRDYGIDVVAVRWRLRIGVQVKRLDGPVGNGAVQQAIAGAGHHDCELAAVVTQSRFTSAARAQAAKAKPAVVLIDRQALPELAQRLRRAR